MHFISNSSILESVIFQLPEMTGFFIFSLTENISISDTGLLKHYYWLNSYTYLRYFISYIIFFINQTGDYKSLLNFVSTKE